MAVPAHVRIEYRGVFGTAGAPQEQWSFSLNHEDVNVDDAQLLYDLAVQAGGAYVTNLKPIMPQNVVLTEVRLARIDGLGRVRTRADGSYLQGLVPAEGQGDGGPINAPPQLAVAVSLTTNRGGPTGKGRFFLPMPNKIPSLVDRRLSEEDALDIATRCAALINSLNGSIGFGGVVVASSKGYLSGVTGVKVGRAVDTIRSRRSDLPEGYIAVAV